MSKLPQLYTISAHEISAQDFFNTLLAKQADLVLDVRLKNTSQLCGFTKAKDLAYFCRTIAHATYIHDLDFAPTPKLLASYLQQPTQYAAYFAAYRALLLERDICNKFAQKYEKYENIFLLGTATKHRHSHSEELLAFLQEKM